MHSNNQCKSCGAPIVFLKTAKGHMAPVDAATVLEGDKDLDLTRHISHFVNCPNSDQHRKPRTIKV